MAAERDRTAGRPRPASQPRRGRRRAPWLVALVGVLLLIGRGIGWFGTADDPQRGERVADGNGGAFEAGEGRRLTRPAVVEPAPQPRPSKASEPQGPTESQLASTSRSSPSPPPSSPTPSPTPAPTIEPAASESPAVPPDRFESLLALLDEYIGNGRIGDGLALLARIDAQPMSAMQRQRMADRAQRLTDLRGAAEQRILEQVTNGEVLAADEAAAALAVQDTWPVAELCSKLPQWPLRADWSLPVTRDVEPAPQPTALEPHRRVRVRLANGVRTGAVANSDGGKVTVKVRVGARQRFPTVAVTELEPTESTVAEAVEMGWFAVHAGRARLARLWLLRALLQCGDDLPERGRQLLRLLHVD